MDIFLEALPALGAAWAQILQPIVIGYFDRWSLHGPHNWCVSRAWWGLQAYHFYFLSCLAWTLP